MGLIPPEQREILLALHAGAIGRTVRCTPSRRTVRVDGPPVLYGKWQVGHGAEAAREWHWLHLLPLLGIRVPGPVTWLGGRRRSLLVTAEAPGRPMDAWMVEAAAEGWLDRLCEYAVAHIAPAIARLHANHLAYRDLYWNHIFVADPRGTEPPTFVDVARVFRPRWRWRRWLVKDFAGLLASAPVEVPMSARLRFLRRAQDGAPLEPALMTAIERKARRIREHAPKYG